MLQLRSLQYLERYIYLILFNAYLHLEKKDSWQRPFSLWMREVRLSLPKLPARPRSTSYLPGAGEQTPMFILYLSDFHTLVGGIGCGPFALGELPHHLALQESQAGHWGHVASHRMGRVLLPPQTCPFSSFELPRVLFFICQL